MHRPAIDWARLDEAIANSDSPHGRVYAGLRRMILVRKTLPAFADETTVFFDTGNAHVLGFVRNGGVLVLANFSEYPQVVTWESLGAAWTIPLTAIDLITEEPVLTNLSLVMPGHGIVWLASE